MAAIAPQGSLLYNQAMRYAFLLALILAAMAAASCGGSGEADYEPSMTDFEMAEQEFIEKELAFEDAPQAAAQTEVVKEVLVEVEKAVGVQGAQGADGLAYDEPQPPIQIPRQRIIVRNVDMSLVVDDVADGVDAIGSLAAELGGWVVSSDRSQKHYGFVSIRVPAEMLDAAIDRLRRLAVEVGSEVLSSRDVTDEYVDTASRLTNLRATEDALLGLLERAEKVEDALDVQAELSNVRQEIERLQGRIKFLEETSAFSLVNISLELAPADMRVDAGLDQTLSVGQPARFRASFVPPEGIEEFTFTWDFGDGSQPLIGSRTAPSLEPGRRFTATVNHVYADERDSPYIVEVEIIGTGDAGLAEGSDTIIATVTNVPKIEVFAGESRIVEAGEKVEFLGSFTRPKGLTDLTFQWDFGDGSPPARDALDQNVTRAEAAHVYIDHRPSAYTATLTITAQSEAGEVEASSSLSVLVRESRGWTVAGWNPGNTGKSAVRALSGLGQVLVNILIWLGLFSPVLIVIGVIVVYIKRRYRRASK